MINIYIIIFMNYMNKTRSELIIICKENKIKGKKMIKIVDSDSDTEDVPVSKKP